MFDSYHFTYISNYQYYTILKNKKEMGYIQTTVSFRAKEKNS